MIDLHVGFSNIVTYGTGDTDASLGQHIMIVDCMCVMLDLACLRRSAGRMHVVLVTDEVNTMYNFTPILFHLHKCNFNLLSIRPVLEVQYA